MSIKRIVGQVNTEKFAIREEEPSTAFLEAINQMPLLLMETALSDEAYLVEWAVDDRDNAFRRALFSTCEDLGYTNWEVLQDHLNREVFEPDGTLYVPRYLVDVLAEEETQEFKGYIKKANAALLKTRGEVIERLNEMMEEHNIPTLAALEALVGSLPQSYISRKIRNNRSPSKKVQNGDDLWVTDGYIAEIAGQNDCPYRDQLPVAGFNIQDTLDMLDENYEEATLSPLVIRNGYMRKLAVLQSENHTVYINDEYTELLYSGNSILIGGASKPVFVKDGHKVVKVIMPFRVDPGRDVTSESKEYREILALLQDVGDRG